MKNIFKVLMCICALSVASIGLAYAGLAEDKATEVKGVIAYLEKDYDRAYSLLLPLAQRGFPRAQLHIGFMFEWGHGVPKDYEKAASYYKSSAEQGYAHAQLVFGSCLVTGPCFPHDVPRGIELLESSARNGIDAAFLDLAFMYQRGEGVPKDYVLALKWFNLAAASFDGWATHRDSMESEMTPAQIARAQKLSREWKAIK